MWAVSVGGCRALQHWCPCEDKWQPCQGHTPPLQSWQDRAPAAPTLQRTRCPPSLQSCPLGWELQRAPLHDQRDILMLNGSHRHPDRGGRSRDAEPRATRPLCVDPSRRVHKDALGPVQQVIPRLLRAEVWFSLGLVLRTALRQPSIPWARLGCSGRCSAGPRHSHGGASDSRLPERHRQRHLPARHPAGLQGRPGCKIHGVEPGRRWRVRSFPPPLRAGPLWGKTLLLLIC